MKNRLGMEERKFAEIIWREAPVKSGKLIEIAKEELKWKKTTSYTVLKRLEEKGLFRNENSTVSVVTTKETYLNRESRDYVEEAFGGSLPAFFMAFVSQGKISREEALRLKKMIEDAEKNRED